MSFGPPLVIKSDEPPKPWTRSDSWKLAAYALFSAVNVGTVLYVAQNHQPLVPEPPAATQPAAVQTPNSPR